MGFRNTPVFLEVKKLDSRAENKISGSGFFIGVKVGSEMIKIGGKKGSALPMWIFLITLGIVVILMVRFLILG